jgi:SAM-dependent methyltransferase
VWGTSLITPTMAPGELVAELDQSLRPQRAQRRPATLGPDGAAKSEYVNCPGGAAGDDQHQRGHSGTWGVTTGRAKDSAARYWDLGLRNPPPGEVSPYPAGMAVDLEGFDPAAFVELAELEDRSWWFRSRNRLIEQTVRRFYAHATSALEIGCGTGYTLRALRGALPGAQLTGTELFEEGLAVSRRRWPNIRLMQADARALPFGTDFDLVTAFDVLEHIDDDTAALSELLRVLKPGGGVILTVPQHRWLWSAADDYGHHQRRYSRTELISRVETAGFLLQMVTSFVTLQLPAMMLSRFRSQLRRQRVEDFDPRAELEIPRLLDRTFETLAAAERSAIARGVSMPFGGSLLLVGERAR